LEWDHIQKLPQDAVRIKPDTERLLQGAIGCVSFLFSKKSKRHPVSL